MTGLYKVCLSTRLDCFISIHLVRSGRIKKNWCHFVELTYPPAQIETRTIREPGIQKIEIEILRTRQCHSALDGGAGYDLDAPLLQYELNEFTCIFVILNVEDTKGIFVFHSFNGYGANSLIAAGIGLRCTNEILKGPGRHIFSRSVGKDMPARPYPACCVSRL